MKPAWKSQTIVSAVAGYALLAGTTLSTAIHEKRFLNETELATILSGYYVLEKTILGRLKAKQDITFKPQITSLPTIAIPEASITLPNFSEIEALPGPVEYDNVKLEPDSEEEDFLQVDLRNFEDRSYFIKVKQKTVIKTEIKDSMLLTSSQYKILNEENILDIKSWKFIETKNHIEIILSSDSNKYYVFAPHVTVHDLSGKIVSLFTESSNKTPFNLPNMKSTFYLEDPIIPNGHFSWGEATKNGTRLPHSISIVESIIAIAKELEEIRSWFGDKPIKITSWFRPGSDSPYGDINRKVGGSKNSFHTKGNAVDFYVVGENTWEVQKVMIKKWKKGGLGLGASKGFCHIDLGPVRQWNY